jgi:hypothetical protein
VEVALVNIMQVAVVVLVELVEKAHSIMRQLVDRDFAVTY